MSACELAHILSDVVGRPVQAIDVPLQAFHDQFAAMGLSPYMVTGAVRSRVGEQPQREARSHAFRSRSSARRLAR